jgi:hypothetical protein
LDENIRIFIVIVPSGRVLKEGDEGRGRQMGDEGNERGGEKEEFYGL